MNTAHIVAELRRAVKATGTLRAFARASGVSPAYVCLVLAGKRLPGPAILRALGLRTTVVRNAKPLR